MTTTTKGKNTKQGKKSNMRLTDTGDMEEPIGKLELMRWIASGLLVLIAILLLIAFVSNLFTGAEDQSYSAGVPAANWLGVSLYFAL